MFELNSHDGWKTGYGTFFCKTQKKFEKFIAEICGNIAEICGQIFRQFSKQHFQHVWPWPKIFQNNELCEFQKLD